MGSRPLEHSLLLVSTSLIIHAVCIAAHSYEESMLLHPDTFVGCMGFSEAFVWPQHDLLFAQGVESSR